MTEQVYYYKATDKGGVSHYPYGAKYTYHIGLNVHPKPDKKSKSSCGEGIHLAKTVKGALTYVKDAGEIYLARAGVILGEDATKVRCTHCWIDRQLSREEIDRVKENDKIMADLSLKTVEPLCGFNWLKDHAGDVTQEMIDACTLEVSSGTRTLTLKNKLKKKDLRAILGTV